MTANQSPFDIFTVAHVAAGYLLKRGGWSLESTLMVAVVWEALEPTLKASNPGAFPRSQIDSTENKVVDVLATMFGWSMRAL